jgi:hypothetical protein
MTRLTVENTENKHEKNKQNNIEIKILKDQKESNRYRR